MLKCDRQMLATLDQCSVYTNVHQHRLNSDCSSIQIYIEILLLSHSTMSFVEFFNCSNIRIKFNWRAFFSSFFHLAFPFIILQSATYRLLHFSRALNVCHFPKFVVFCRYFCCCTQYERNICYSFSLTSVKCFSNFNCKT